MTASVVEGARRTRPDASARARRTAARQEAERRGGAGGRRNDDLAHAEHPGHVGGMSRSGAAEAHHGVVARVLALLDEMDPGRRRHALVHDLVDAPRRLLDREAERLGDARQRALRGRLSSRMRPPRKKAGIVVAEHQVGVGDGRLRAAHAVAGGPGSEPGESGPTLSRPTSSMAAIDPPPAPISIMSMTGALMGRPEARLKRWTRPASSIGGDLDAAVLDQAGLRGRAAHVERDHVLLAGERAEQGGGEAAAGGPDSSRRIGNARAVSGDTRPPAECISRRAPRKPRAESSSSSRFR